MVEAAAREGVEFPRAEGAAAKGRRDALWLDEAGFVAAVDHVFGHHKYTTHAHKLFQLLDPFCSGRVRWRQLVCKLVDVGARKTRSRAEVWTALPEPAVSRLEHCKRETILKLVSIEREDCFCYAAVSRGGRVGIYSGLLKLVHSYEVFFHRLGITRRVKNCWITDAVYLCDVQCVIYSASDRSLTVYDAATVTHTPVFCITGLPNIPTCMSYCPPRSELALGTERGDVTRLRFLQPRVSLFHTKSTENINYYFWMELSSPPHTGYCAIQTCRGAHARSVRRVAHGRRGALLSCSHDAAAGLRARHAAALLPDYVFKVQRGVSCFHLVPSLHLVATGSPDGAVRLWDSTQGAPTARLPPALAPGAPAVLDVLVVAPKQIVVAYFSNCWLHIWDLYEECLLQTIKIKFPCLGVLGKRVEFGTTCIHPGPARKSASADELPQDLTSASLGAASRRGSSVYQGSTGGLILQAEPDEEQSNEVEDDPEYIRYNRPELLVTCCDYVAAVSLCPAPPGGPVLPPPGDSLRARRPSFWDLPDDVFAPSPSPPPPACPPPPPAPSPLLLTPAAAEHPPQDMDTLLKDAGLQGILEKDFVLMYGLKHDLNRKLANLEANKDAMLAAVSLGAPYLALRMKDPEPLGPGDDMMEAYRRVMKLFPGPSVTNTPSSSGPSTPRKRTSHSNGAK